MGVIISCNIRTNECITTTTKNIKFGEPLLMAKNSQKIDTMWIHLRNIHVIEMEGLEHKD